MNGAIAFPPTGAPRYWEPELDDTLICRHVRDETHDVRSFVFESPGRELFAFHPGQFLTFTFAQHPAGTISRCYTISSPPTRPYQVSITVKRVEGGPVSNWLHDHLRPSTRVQATGPIGDFTNALRPAAKLLLLSAGSGITPMLSMARAQDDSGGDTNILFVHSAHTPEDIICRDEIALMERHRPGFRAAFVCSRDRPQARWPGYRGRLDQAMLRVIAPDLRERDIFLCGPAGYMSAVTGMLDACGADPARVFRESFDFGQLQRDDPDIAAASAELASETGFTITLARSNRRLSCGPDTFLLDAARAQGARMASACTKGVCGTCKTRKISGEVVMTHGGGIRQREIDAGMILPCCSKPMGDIVLDA